MQSYLGLYLSMAAPVVLHTFLFVINTFIGDTKTL